MALTFFSAFLKKITKTRSSANFLNSEPNGQGYNASSQQMIEKSCPKLFMKVQLDNRFKVLTAMLSILWVCFHTPSDSYWLNTDCAFVHIGKRRKEMRAQYLSSSVTADTCQAPSRVSQATGSNTSCLLVVSCNRSSTF